MRVIHRRSMLLKLAALVSALIFGITVFVMHDRQKVEAASNGPSPSHTNAPGEDNCTTCHVSFPVDSGTGSVQITGIPHDYKPGQQYAVSVTTSQDDAVIYGFQLTAIDHTGQAAGSFSLSNATTTQSKVGTVGGNLRQYIEHTTAGLYTNGVRGSNTWSFIWTAPAQRIGKIGFYAAGKAANSNGTPTGDYIYTKNAGSLAGTAIANFDGDLASDIAYYRPTKNVWFSYNILTNTSQGFTLGIKNDLIAPGDYDGDGKTDFAVFRPATGTWYIQRSTLGYVEIPWGAAGDVPVPGDYDGDGKWDTAVFRPATGEWLINRSTAGPVTITLGQAGDKIAQGDYDGDGITDLGVYRPSNGTWYLLMSAAGPLTHQFGTAEDRPVQGDYDGDGQVDMAVFRPSTNSWIIEQSTNGPTTVVFGSTGDRLAPADYDGDGRTDISTYTPPPNRASNGVWHILLSSDSSTYNKTIGLPRDLPVAGGYIAQ